MAARASVAPYAGWAVLQAKTVRQVDATEGPALLNRVHRPSLRRTCGTAISSRLTRIARKSATSPAAAPTFFPGLNPVESNLQSLDRSPPSKPDEPSLPLHFLKNNTASIRWRPFCLHKDWCGRRRKRLPKAMRLSPCPSFRAWRMLIAR